MDEPRLARLVDAAHAVGLTVTCHRAIDVAAPDALAALAAVERCGCDAVLSSGGASSAEAGIARLAQMVRSASRAEVVCGGGVSEANAARLVAATGARWLHGTARRAVPTAAAASGGWPVDFCSPPSQAVRHFTCAARVVRSRARGGGGERQRKAGLMQHALTVGSRALARRPRSCRRQGCEGVSGRLVQLRKYSRCAQGSGGLLTPC